MKEVIIKNRNNRNINLVCYEVDNPKAIIILVHGASEHIKRYEELAIFLNKYQINVYGYDHLGHGINLNKELNNIYFNDGNAHIDLITDLEDVCLHVYTHNTSLPLFVFGHSMGSLIVRGLAILTRLNIDGMIICGSMNPNIKTINSGLILASLITKLEGKKRASKLLNKIAFGSLEKRISYNQDNINKYKLDNCCGLLFSNKAIIDLLELTKLVSDKANICLMSKTKYFFISGEDDKFSDNTKQVQEVIDYMKTNCFDVQYKYYANARHEILMEASKEEVMNDIVNFINNTIE
ncbi:MAG: lysophospholipase [Bacilli bacterium]|jgi:alpha-beta hydrolase superfamily lysophospholipase|nr:lysophospholipase [Bacilli bacterium]